MSSGYKVAPLFLIRLAGAPFEILDRLATPEALRAGRVLMAEKEKLAAAAAAAQKLFHSRERMLSDEAYRSLRHAVRTGGVPAPVSDVQPSVFTDYDDAAKRVRDLTINLQKILKAELSVARRALFAASEKFLPPYAIFAAPGFSHRLPVLLAEHAADDNWLQRNTRARERDRLLILYLQRLAAKNDTFGEFGPTSWGRAVANKNSNSLENAPGEGMTRRDVFLERWTAHAIAAVMNTDPEVFAELLPRLNPNGIHKDNTFVLMNTGNALPLDPSEMEIAAQCSGRVAVHTMPASPELIRSLVDRDVLRCAVEVPALQPHAFEILRDDVSAWRHGPARAKWLPILDKFARLAERLSVSFGVPDRLAVIDEAYAQLHKLGIEEKTRDRSLYAAVNPLGEECSRQSHFAISSELLAEVATDAAPWIDLWRDSYAFIASRVASGLRPIFEQASGSSAAVPLPRFLQACESARLSLTGPGLVALAVIAFQEVKSAFRQRLEPHANEEEYALTIEDCHVVRNTFDYPRFDDYTYPSADLQISAESLEAVDRGQYQWLLAELHPPVALLHHCMYWDCPDRATLNEAFASTIFGRPNFHFGFFAADFTAHTTVRLFDALPEFSNFVAPQRGNPDWRSVRPADAEVYVDESGDVALRKADSGEHLGSFARAWLIPLGFHPFQFALTGHTPRLRCGRVIVQRRSWTIQQSEWPSGDYAGVSGNLVLAAEELRARKNLPRRIYIRPTERALRRSGAEGRDKDTKPVFIDLESYLFLEIFHRWLSKAGELEVTEMLPDADHLLWHEANGRHTFELRTLIVPQS